LGGGVKGDGGVCKNSLDDTYSFIIVERCT
jgi:hypothetical protein